jgi:Fuc2NAc and GlcNAc transferase
MSAALVAALALGACLAAWLLLFPLRGWLAKRGVLDIPNERSSHLEARPRGGGLAIAGVSLAGLLALQLSRPQADWRLLAGYFAGALIVAGVSWLDDLRSMSWVARLGAQSAAALVVIASGGYFRGVGLPGVSELQLGWLGLPLTFLWIVGLTNAYNFMDGIDGLAGSQALIAGLGWAILGSALHVPLVAGLGALIAGSSAGFLAHNWPPARIFMGDVGSAYLGYALAFLPVAASQTQPVLALPGLLLVWPFVLDAGLTFGRRALRRERVFEPHRTHVYQRLVARGASHAQATVLYSALALIGLAASCTWVLAR